jgi:hypothetical protein
MVFQNTALRKIFGPKRNEVFVDYVVTSSVLLAKYHSDDQIKRNEIGGACSTYGEEMVGKPGE